MLSSPPAAARPLRFPLPLLFVPFLTPRSPVVPQILPSQLSALSPGCLCPVSCCHPHPRHGAALAPAHPPYRWVLQGCLRHGFAHLWLELTGHRSQNQGDTSGSVPGSWGRSCHVHPAQREEALTFRDEYKARKRVYPGTARAWTHFTVGWEGLWLVPVLSGSREPSLSLLRCDASADAKGVAMAVGWSQAPCLYLPPFLPR